MVGTSQAETVAGLELAPGEGDQQALRFADAAMLDCDFLLPEGWIVTPGDTPDAAFDAAAIFSAMERRFLCYDPQNRDRCEVEVYAAKILPEWVGLAGHYAQILARVWGPDKYATAAPDPLFGEALTGGDWFGQASQTRISVWRRGEWLLILRGRYRMENAATYRPALAGIVGSVGFANAGYADPIAAALIADPMALEDGRIVTMRPDWWRNPGFAEPPADKGSFQFWVDEADPDRNSGAMLTAQRVEPLPDDMPGPPEGVMAQQADDTLAFTLENLVPTQQVKRSQTAAFTLKRTDHAAFDRSYVYRLDFEGSGALGIAQVTQVLTRDGRLIVSVVFTLAPRALDEVAPHLHTTWFENQINTAVTAFLADRVPFSPS